VRLSLTPRHWPASFPVPALLQSASCSSSQSYGACRMVNSTQQSSVKVYLRLLRYVIPYWGLFGVSLFGFLIFAATQPMLGYILKFFVDGLSNPDAGLFATVPWLVKHAPWLAELKLLQAVPLLIVLIALLQGVGSFLGNFFL